MVSRTMTAMPTTKFIVKARMDSLKFKQTFNNKKCKSIKLLKIVYVFVNRWVFFDFYILWEKSFDRKNYLL